MKTAWLKKFRIIKFKKPSGAYCTPSESFLPKEPFIECFALFRNRNRQSVRAFGNVSVKSTFHLKFN